MDQKAYQLTATLQVHAWIREAEVNHVRRHQSTPWLQHSATCPLKIEIKERQLAAVYRLHDDARVLTVEPPTPKVGAVVSVNVRNPLHEDMSQVLREDAS